MSKTAISGGLKRWVVDLRGIKEGRKYFKTEQDAHRYATDRALELDYYGALAMSLPLKQRFEIISIEERLKKVGATIGQAIEFFMTHHTAKSSKLISEAVAEWSQVKDGAMRRPRYTEKIRGLIGSIVRASDMPCDKFTKERAREWLDGARDRKTGKPWSGNTKKYAVVDARTFFNWCIKKGWASINPFNEFEKITPEDKAPCILTVDQCVRLMDESAKHPEMLAYATLCLFAGVRPDEAKKMDWTMIDVAGKFCSVPSVISKTRQRRIVRLSDNAIAWLRIADPKEGTLRSKNFRKKWNTVRRNAGFAIKEEIQRYSTEPRKPAVGVEWGADCMRHSFASYHLAEHGAADKTATEMGHRDTKMLFAHYRELVRPLAAKEFWKILPPVDLFDHSDVIC